MFIECIQGCQWVEHVGRGVSCHCAAATDMSVWDAEFLRCICRSLRRSTTALLFTQIQRSHAACKTLNHLQQRCT